MAVALPPTTAFPADPSRLERFELEGQYRALRGSYKSLMISRGVHRSQAQRARGETDQLRQRLMALATREASVRKEVYEMLEIVTSLAGDLEDAGDELTREFGRYSLGRKSFQGGGYLGGLVQAVIRFINRWTRTRERLDQLTEKQQAMQQRLDGATPVPMEMAIEERPDGQGR